VVVLLLTDDAQREFTIREPCGEGEWKLMAINEEKFNQFCKSG